MEVRDTDLVVFGEYDKNSRARTPRTTTTRDKFLHQIEKLLESVQSLSLVFVSFRTSAHRSITSSRSHRCCTDPEPFLKSVHEEIETVLSEVIEETAVRIPPRRSDTTRL